MNININTLRREIKKLPKPKYAGEEYILRLINRVDELNLKHPVTGQVMPPDDDMLVSYIELKLTAEPYHCNLNSWFEWELKYNEEKQTCPKK